MIPRSLKRKYYGVPVWGWALGAIAIISLVVFMVTRPAHGTWRFAACRTLLETTVRFPATIELVGVGEAAQSATLLYTDINAYGTQQIKTFECHYVMEASGNIRLSRVVQNRRAFSDEILADLNKKLPTILAQELDTTLPKPIPSDLKKIKR